MEGHFLPFPSAAAFSGRGFSDQLAIALSGRSTDVQYVHYILQFFKSLILQTLWIHDFCDFMSYLAFWLYLGCMDLY
jgi:hypothetical protein